jgi:hypothetical protein
MIGHPHSQLASYKRWADRALVMSEQQPTCVNRRALTTAPLAFAWLTALAGFGSTATAYAQSAAAPDTATANRPAVSGKPATPADAASPFVYDALGATPTVRLLGRRSSQPAAAPKEVKPFDHASAEKTLRSAPTRTVPQADAR